MNLEIAKAGDLTDPRDRRIYRFLEILPGAISWLTIFLAVFLSWKQPLLVAVFILIFDIYWLFRSIYFSFHLRASYKRMEQAKNTDWLEKLKQIPDWEKICHLCLLTLCKEPYEVVRDTFAALLNGDYPKEKIIIVLSAEERYKNLTQETVARIEREFGSKFFRFLTTWHPAGLAGEIIGKGANDAWAAKAAKKEIIDALKIPYEKVIVTFFDVDTCVFPKYFSCLSWHYLTSKEPAKNSFQPIPLFINNIWQAPAFSRNFSFSASFWNALSQERPEFLVTFSSHSMSFKALVDVDFKQTNVISDDSHIFWQCFLKYDGRYRVQPLFYPVAMDANVGANFLKTLVSIYKQQRRWAYGVQEIPYVFFNFLKNKKIPLKTKILQGLFLFESHWSWATNALLIFFLGWLPVILGRGQFGQALILHNLPRITSNLMTITMLGILVSIYLSLVLLPPKPKSKTNFGYLFFILEWFLVPLTMIFFGSIPALDAQTRLMLGKYKTCVWPTDKVRK